MRGSNSVAPVAFLNLVELVTVRYHPALRRGWRGNSRRGGWIVARSCSGRCCRRRRTGTRARGTCFYNPFSVILMMEAEVANIPFILATTQYLRPLANAQGLVSCRLGFHFSKSSTLIE